MGFNGPGKIFHKGLIAKKYMGMSFFHFAFHRTGIDQTSCINYVR